MQHGIKYVIFDETRIRTWVIADTTQCTNHYTLSAHVMTTIIPHPCRLMGCSHLPKYKIFRQEGQDANLKSKIILPYCPSHYTTSMEVN